MQYTSYNGEIPDGTATVVLVVSSELQKGLNAFLSGVPYRVARKNSSENYIEFAAEYWEAAQKAVEASNALARLTEASKATEITTLK